MTLLSIPLQRRFRFRYIMRKKEILSAVLYLLPITMLISFYRYKVVTVQHRSVYVGSNTLLPSLLETLPSNTIYYRQDENATLSTFLNSDKSHSIGAKYFDIEALLPWENRTLLKATKGHRYAKFKQVMTAMEYKKTMDLLHTFKNVCELNNLTFFLYGGSMLGAYRHFGMIPWDDDIDVLMDIRHRDKIAAALDDVPGYNVRIRRNFQWKFYLQRENNTNKWPYIDIFFFKENSTHIWDNTSIFDPNYCYKRTDVFPLSLFPFENFFMPVPRHLRDALAVSYNVDLCSSLHYSHKREHGVKKVYTVPCRRLYNLFPFVFETRLNEYTVHRSLKRGDLVIYDMVFS